MVSDWCQRRNVLKAIGCAAASMSHAVRGTIRSNSTEPEQDREARSNSIAPSVGGATAPLVMPDGGIDKDRENTELQMEREEAMNLKRDLVELRHFVTQDTRYTLLMRMLGHRAQAPSLEELVFLHPDKSRTAIKEHLDKLVEWGFVDKLVIPKGDRTRSLPHAFYRVSDVGRRFLAQNQLMPMTVDELRRRQAELPKTDKIRRYENAPREDAVVRYDEVDETKVAQLKALVDSYVDRDGRPVVEAESVGRDILNTLKRMISGKIWGKSAFRSGVLGSGYEAEDYEAGLNSLRNVEDYSRQSNDSYQTENGDEVESKLRP